MAFNVSALGFGDNVVDCYEHIHTMYPGGNAVNFAVYAKKCGAARSAYMGIFGNDAAAGGALGAVLLVHFVLSFLYLVFMCSCTRVSCDYAFNGWVADAGKKLALYVCPSPLLA